MANVPHEFWMLYIQDFDLVFDRDIDPVDLFCQQHDERDQQELLRHLTDFYAGVLSGQRSIQELVDLGLEYVPGDEQHPETWMPRLIERLKERMGYLANESPQR